METKTKVFLVSIALLASFAAGRFLAPTKVVTETKIVEVEKKTENSNTTVDKNRRKRTEIHEITHPDGRKEVITIITDETDTKKNTDSSSSSETSKNEETRKEVVRSDSKVSLSALGGIKLNNPSEGVVYGASVSKPVIGPISIGVWGLSNSTAGASVGLSF